MTVPHKLGDLPANVERLRGELRRARYDGELSLDAVSSGDPTPFLPLLHFILLGFSKSVAHWLAELGYELYAKSDLRFVETVYRLARQELNYRHSLTCKQFFKATGFAERKVLFVFDLLLLIKKKHTELQREAGVPLIRGPPISALIHSRRPTLSLHEPPQTPLQQVTVTGTIKTPPVRETADMARIGLSARYAEPVDAAMYRAPAAFPAAHFSPPWAPAACSPQPEEDLEHHREEDSPQPRPPLEPLQLMAAVARAPAAPVVSDEAAEVFHSGDGAAENCEQRSHEEVVEEEESVVVVEEEEEDEEEEMVKEVAVKEEAVREEAAEEDAVKSTQVSSSDEPCDSPVGSEQALQICTLSCADPSSHQCSIQMDELRHLLQASLPCSAPSVTPQLPHLPHPVCHTPFATPRLPHPVCHTPFAPLITGTI